MYRYCIQFVAISFKILFFFSFFFWGGGGVTLRIKMLVNMAKKKKPHSLQIGDVVMNYNFLY